MTTNDALEPGRALDAPLEDLGHATTADALEERVLAELNRLGELGCHEDPADRSRVPELREGDEREDASLPAGSYMIAIPCVYRK